MNAIEWSLKKEKYTELFEQYTELFEQYDSYIQT